MGFLHGKRALITGIANQLSMAWGVANAMHREGAQLAFIYPNQHFKHRAEEAANAFGSNLVLACDVADDTKIAGVFTELARHWVGLDILVHTIDLGSHEAGPANVLEGLTRENFALAHDPSYSLAALAKAARPLMAGRCGAILALTYSWPTWGFDHRCLASMAKASLEANVRYLACHLGAETTRVNAISAGPLTDLAATDVADSPRMLDQTEQHAPLRRYVTIEEVGNVAAFLCSDLASGVTGEVTHVDAGCHVRMA